MRHRAVEVVGHERAARAALLPVRTKHEVVDDELTVAAEEVREADLPVRCVEHVVLLDADPRQLAALASEFVALPRELLLLRQVSAAPLDPLLLGHDPMRGHGCLLGNLLLPPGLSRPARWRAGPVMVCRPRCGASYSHIGI